jgi:hypothetical protein
MRSFKGLALIVIATLVLSACSGQKKVTPTPTAKPTHTAPPVTLAGGQSGFYLVVGGKAMLLHAQRLAPGIDISGLPQVNEPRPVALLNSDDVVTRKLSLMRMAFGLGIGVNLGDKGISVARVMKGYAAERVDVQTGDVLLAIDGHKIADLAYHVNYFDKVVDYSAGELGSKANLTLQRGAQTIDVTVVRDFPIPMGGGAVEIDFRAEQDPQGYARLVPDELVTDGL